MTIMLLNPR